MATSLELCGFEGQDFTGIFPNGSATVRSTSGRFGSYGLSVQPAGAVTYGAVIGTATDVGSRLAFAAYLQCYIRFNNYPTANGSMFMGFSSGDTTVSLNIDGSLTLTKAGIGSISRSGTAVPRNLWLRCILCTWVSIDCPLPNAPVPLQTSFQWSYRDANGVLQAFDAVVLNGVALNSHNFLRGVLGSQAGAGNVTTWDFDVDDVIYLAADSYADMNTISKWLLHDNNGRAVPGSFILPGSLDYLPSLFYYDHVAILKLAAEAPGFGFAPQGNVAITKALPSASARVPLETSNDVGVAAIYIKEQAPMGAENWIFHDITGPDTYKNVVVQRTVEGYQLKGNATSAPSGDHQLLLDSYVPAPPVSSLSGVTANGNDVSPRTPARFIYGQLGKMLSVSAFNGFQPELVNKTGGLVSLTNLYIEYLAAGSDALVAGVPGQSLGTVPAQSVVAGVGPGAPPAEGNEPITSCAPNACGNLNQPVAAGAGSGCTEDSSAPAANAGCPT